SRSVVTQAPSEPNSQVMSPPSSSAARNPLSGSNSAVAATSTVSVPAAGSRRWMAAATVAAILVLAAAGVFWYRGHSSRQEISSIAVLPFVNASNDANNEYLSDGLTEGLINSLSQVPNLAVMSRSSVFHYKGKDADPETVAHDLKVDGVVTGRITEHGDQ